MRTAPEPVPWVADLVPATHGSLDRSAAEATGVEETAILDFSANGNVIGPPPGIAEELAEVDVSRYPDRGALVLRQAIALRDDLSVDAVVVGNGSTELIWAVARAYLTSGRRALVVSPTYGEYAVASHAAGAEVRAFWMAPGPATGKSWALDPPALTRKLQEEGPAVLWLCHPNNPTGAAFGVESLPELMAAAPRCLVVIDEAYLPLCKGLGSAVPFLGTGRVLVLRSLSKDLGLAGIRVGYGLASSEIADVLRRVLPPWSVSSLAQIAACKGMDEPAHLERARKAVEAARAHLVAGLRGLGLQPYTSVANFVLVPVGEAARLAEALLSRGFAVRDCTSFGLPHCIRIGVRAIPEQEQLLAALAQVWRG